MGSNGSLSGGAAPQLVLKAPPHWQLGLRKAAPGVSQFEVFNHNVRHICGPYRLESERWWRFQGDVRNFEVAALNVTDLRISDGRVIRDNRGDDLHRGDYYALVMQVDGVARMCQRGAEATLQPGDCTLIDSRLPSVFHVGNGVRQYSFNFAAPGIRELLGRDSAFVCRRIGGSSGSGAVLSETLRSIIRHAPTLTGADLLQSTLALLAAAVGRAAAGAHDQAAHLAISSSEIMGYIDAHVHEPALTPQQIAGYFNVSLRQLYRVAAQANYTPAALIWERRLQRARELLVSSPHLPVTEVAFSCGFKDGAHFSRSYRKAFGQPPRLARRRCAQT